MTTAQINNVLWYVAIAVGSAIMATGLQLGVVLAGTDPVLIRPLLATFVNVLFGTLLTAGGTAFRPRAGREDLSSLVSEVGAEKAKDVLAIEAIRQDTGVTTALSDADIGRITDRLLAENEARMMATKEGRG